MMTYPEMRFMLVLCPLLSGLIGWGTSRLVPHGHRIKKGAGQGGDQTRPLDTFLGAARLGRSSLAVDKKGSRFRSPAKR